MSSATRARRSRSRGRPRGRISRASRSSELAAAHLAGSSWQGRGGPRRRLGARGVERKPLGAAWACPRRGSLLDGADASRRRRSSSGRSRDFFDEIGATRTRAEHSSSRASRSGRRATRSRRAARRARPCAQLLSLEERAKVIEATATLAELVLAKGHVEEAERWALSAVETVGMQDMMSAGERPDGAGQVRAGAGPAMTRPSCSSTGDRHARGDRLRNVEPEPMRGVRSVPASRGAGRRGREIESGSTRCFSR